MKQARIWTSWAGLACKSYPPPNLAIQVILVLVSTLRLLVGWRLAICFLLPRDDELEGSLVTAEPHFCKYTCSNTVFVYHNTTTPTLLHGARIFT